jgi:hypothetical protein
MAVAQTGCLAACLAARADAELGQDSRHVVVNCLGRHKKPLGDVGIAQPSANNSRISSSRAVRPAAFQRVLRRGTRGRPRAQASAAALGPPLRRVRPLTDDLCRIRLRDRLGYARRHQTGSPTPAGQLADDPCGPPLNFQIERRVGLISNCRRPRRRGTPTDPATSRTPTPGTPRASPAERRARAIASTPGSMQQRRARSWGSPAISVVG